MYQFCFTIGGKRRCFDVPTLIDKNVIRRPPANNYPPFDLAVSVILLTEAVPQFGTLNAATRGCDRLYSTSAE